MKTDKELYKRLNIARTMAEGGRYSEALAEFLYFVENLQSLGAFGRANRDFIISEIFELADNLPEAPEALKALAAIRDGLEISILAGDGGWSTLHDVHILNEHLEQPERDLVLLDQLTNLGPNFKRLHQKFLNVAWEQLARAGRHAELAECIDERAQEAAGALARYQVQWEFAEDDEQREDAKGMLQYFLPSALLAYKTLLILDKDGVALKLAKCVFDCEPLTLVQPVFIETTKEFGKSDLASQLAQMRETLLLTANTGNAGTVSPVPTSGDHSQDFEGDTP